MFTKQCGSLLQHTYMEIKTFDIESETQCCNRVAGAITSTPGATYIAGAITSTPGVIYTGVAGAITSTPGVIYTGVAGAITSILDVITSTPGPIYWCYYIYTGCYIHWFAGAITLLGMDRCNKSSTSI